MPDQLSDVAAIGALVDPARRALYRYVTAQAHAVGREEAARAVDLPAHSAKFHLDRLVDEGLLDVEFRRLSGRSGPGAGRPAKLYRRSARQLTLSLPPRHYDLSGEILAAAIDRSVRDGIPITDAVRDSATTRGRRLATSLEAPGSAPGRDSLSSAAEVLAEHGYEPRLVDDQVRLANCPFDRLAAEHTALVCQMNLALVTGMIDGLEVRDVVAELDPAPGFCCVKLSKRSTD